MSWLLEHGTEAHVIPVDDLVGHERSLDCACGPHVEWVDPGTGVTHERPLVSHYSLDGREAVEV